MTGTARAAEQSRCSDQGSDESSALKTVALVVPAFGRLALTTFPRGHATLLVIRTLTSRKVCAHPVSVIHSALRTRMPRCGAPHERRGREHEHLG